MWLLAAFILLPIVEIALFIQVGGWIGLWPTLGLVILMAIAGTWLARSQGALALADIRRSVDTLDDPTGPMAHGALILMAAVLMMIPGFFTDILGLMLLIRPVRSWVIGRLARRLRVVAVGGARPPAEGGDVIDGTWREVDQDSLPKPPSGWTRH